MKNGSKNDECSCVKCGTCNTVCPVYLVTGNEINTPRGKQHLRSRIDEGETSSHYAGIFSQCLLCNACLEVCPRGLDTPKMVIQARSELPRLSGLSFLKYISRRALTHPSLLANLTNLGLATQTLLGNLLPEDSGLRLRLQAFSKDSFKLPAAGYIEKLKVESAGSEDQHERGSKVRINFFTGCLANHLQPEIAEATQVLLQATTDTSAKVPFSQTCCGMAALAAGRINEARDLAKKNISVFAENDYPILTSCSSCYYQLKSYAELLAGEPEWQQKAAHFSERLREFSSYFLEKFSVENMFPAPGDTDSRKKVLYHDPCHLRFKLHITEQPRQLIRLLPGIELQELPEGPRCCGHGGLFQVAHPDLALEVRARLINDIGTLEAETVLTACSGCLLQWQLGLKGEDKGRRAEHLAVFIARLL
jgi:glycolate dehydrogenase iron-sulfur subunit